MSDIGTIHALDRIFNAMPLRYRPALAWNEGEHGFAVANNELYLHLTVDGPNLLTWYAVKDGREHWREGITFDGETLPASLISLLADELKHEPGPLPHLVNRDPGEGSGR